MISTSTSTSNLKPLRRSDEDGTHAQIVGRNGAVCRGWIWLVEGSVVRQGKKEKGGMLRVRHNRNIKVKLKYHDHGMVSPSDVLVFWYLQGEREIRRRRRCGYNIFFLLKTALNPRPFVSSGGIRLIKCEEWQQPIQTRTCEKQAIPNLSFLRD